MKIILFTLSAFIYSNAIANQIVVGEEVHNSPGPRCWVAEPRDEGAHEIEAKTNARIQCAADAIRVSDWRIKRGACHEWAYVTVAADFLCQTPGEQIDVSAESIADDYNVAYSNALEGLELKAHELAPQGFRVSEVKITSPNFECTKACAVTASVKYQLK